MGRDSLEGHRAGGGQGAGEAVGKRNPFPGKGRARQMERGAVAEKEVRVESDRA